MNESNEHETEVTQGSEPSSTPTTPEPTTESLSETSLNEQLYEYACLYDKRKELKVQSTLLQKQMDRVQEGLVERMVEENCARITVSVHGNDYSVFPANNTTAKIVGSKAELMELFHDDPDNVEMLTVNARSFTSLVKGWVDGDGIPEKYKEFVELGSYTKLSVRSS